MAEEIENGHGLPNEELEDLKRKLNDVLKSISSLQSEQGKMEALNLLKTATSEAQFSVGSTEKQCVSSDTPQIIVGSILHDLVTQVPVDSKTQLNNLKPKKKVGRPRKTESSEKISNKRKSRQPQRIRSENGEKLSNKRIKNSMNGGLEHSEKTEVETSGDNVSAQIQSCNADGDNEDDGDQNRMTTRGPRKWPNQVKKRHQCSLCSKQFSHGHAFNAHVRTHCKQPCCCLKCKKEFYNIAHLDHHTCKPGNSSGTKKVRECSSCGEQFTNRKLFDTHMVKEHGKAPEPRFECFHCGRRFTRQNYLRLHLKLHASENSMFACSVCGEFAETFEALAEHEAVHRANAEATCNICGLFFMRRQQYDQHVLAHKKYDCTICGQWFYRKKVAQRHQRLVHGVKVAQEPKKHECPICGKKMQRPGMLEIHMRLHTGEKPIECKLCHLFFRTPKAYTKHKMTNTHMKRSGEISKEREFMCELCGSAYYRKQALQRHMNASHYKEKLYRCPHCDFSCTEQSNLRVHVSLHFDSARNFVCDMCGAAFHTKKTLNEHTIYKHTEERNFVCEVCSFSFKTKNALVRHAKTHESEKPFVCMCGTSFRRSYNLRRHAIRVHGHDSNLPPVRRVQVLDTNPNAVSSASLKAPPNKRVAKPKQSRIANLLSVPTQPEIPIVSLQSSVLDTTMGHKASETFDDSQPMPSSFLAQLVSAVEFGREGALSLPATVVEGDGADLGTKTCQNDGKTILYKWPQTTQQNTGHVQQYITDGACAFPIQHYFPVATEALRYSSPIQTVESVTREQYQQPPQTAQDIYHINFPPPPTT